VEIFISGHIIMANQVQIPSVEIFHKITNFGKDHVDGLNRELVDAACEDGSGVPGVSEGRQSMQTTVDRLLRPARLLRGEILVPVELVRLYERAGIRDITEERVDELIEYIGSILPAYDPDSPQKKLYEAPMLPARRERLGAGFVLSVAGSQDMLQERALVKGAVLNFYKLKGSYDAAWNDDDRVTGAWLARSSGPKSNALLLMLEGKLHDRPALLPADADIGGAIVRPNPHR